MRIPDDLKDALAVEAPRRNATQAQAIEDACYALYVCVLEIKAKRFHKTKSVIKRAELAAWLFYQGLPGKEECPEQSTLGKSFVNTMVDRLLACKPGREWSPEDRIVYGELCAVWEDKCKQLSYIAMLWAKRRIGEKRALEWGEQAQGYFQAEVFTVAIESYPGEKGLGAEALWEHCTREFTRKINSSIKREHERKDQALGVADDGLGSDQRDSAGPALGPLDQAIKAEDCDRVQRAMMELNDEEFRILTARDYFGWPIKRIAGCFLKKPEAEVSQREEARYRQKLQRARERLGKILNPLQPDKDVQSAISKSLEKVDA